MSFTDVRHLIHFLDSCVDQYKNKKNFLNLCLHGHDFGMSAEWHFFATSHGKGPSDGIGGTIKREATRASLPRIDKGQILSPIELHEFVKDHLHGTNSKFATTRIGIRRANYWKEDLMLQEQSLAHKSYIHLYDQTVIWK